MSIELVNEEMTGNNDDLQQENINLKQKLAHFEANMRTQLTAANAKVIDLNSQLQVYPDKFPILGG